MDNPLYAAILFFTMLSISDCQKVTNLTAIAGGGMLLPCSLTGNPEHPVVWFRPQVSLMGISNDLTLTGPQAGQLGQRMRVFSNEGGGDRNMLIRYVKYPDDSGQWACRTDDQHVEIVHLLILVTPKVKVPSITPPVSSVLSLNSSVYMFKCTAHFAFPPVELNWIRVKGTSAPYHVAPPRYLQSVTQQTLSVSATIILTQQNLGSTFVCVATHPTFLGKNFSSYLNFVTSSFSLNNPHTAASTNRDAAAAASTNQNAAAAASANQNGAADKPTVAALDPLDRTMILLATAITAIEFSVCLIIQKQRRYWQLDVRLRWDQTQSLMDEASCHRANGTAKHKIPASMPSLEMNEKQTKNNHENIKLLAFQSLEKQQQEQQQEVEGNKLHENEQSGEETEFHQRQPETMKQTETLKQSESLKQSETQKQTLKQYKPYGQKYSGRSQDQSLCCVGGRGAEGSGGGESGMAGAGILWRLERRRQVRKVCVSVILLHLLVLSLIFSLPLYYKGVTIPQTSTDEVAGVIAGSALWLDCRQFTQPITSLAQVTWHKGEELFYYQYYSNGRYIGYPANNTAGFMLGMRASAPRGAGQLCIWPMGPDDGGVFSCHVVMDPGRSFMKTITVFVSMGPVVNYAVIVTLSVSLCVSVALSCLFAYHCVIFNRGNSDARQNAF